MDDATPERLLSLAARMADNLSESGNHDPIDPDDVLELAVGYIEFYAFMRNHVQDMLRELKMQRAMLHHMTPG